jgi:hypothetical protein
MYYLQHLFAERRSGLSVWTSKSQTVLTGLIYQRVTTKTPHNQVFKQKYCIALACNLALPDSPLALFAYCFVNNSSTPSPYLDTALSVPRVFCALRSAMLLLSGAIDLESILSIKYEHRSVEKRNRTVRGC